MKSYRPIRWLFLVAAGVISTLFCLGLYRALRSRGQETMVFQDRLDYSDLVRIGENGGGGIGVGKPELRKYYLDKKQVYGLFGLSKKKGTREYDPWCYFREKGPRRYKMIWPEHPDGHFFVETNDLGHRDVPWVERTHLRVLVTGDSQSSGVCNRSENFANRLEVALGERWPDKGIDVVNTATGGYGLYHYIGVLEKFVPQKPDVFVVGLFGGNDLSGIFPVRQVLEGTPSFSFSEEIRARRKQAISRHLILMAHCLNAPLIYKENPEFIDRTIEVGATLIAEMQALCDGIGTKLVIVYIPPACQFTWEPPLERRSKVMGLVDLVEEDCGIVDEIADRLLAAIDAAGTTQIDMRPAFAEQPSAPYWRKDLHMDLTAQRLIADALEPIVVERVEELGWDQLGNLIAGE